MSTSIAKNKKLVPVSPRKIPTTAATALDEVLKSRRFDVAGTVEDIIADMMPSIRIRVYQRLSAELSELARLAAKASLNKFYGKMGSHFVDTDSVLGNGHDMVPHSGLDRDAATEKVVTASAPPPKKIVTPEQRRRQKLHGRYVGLIAHASEDARKKAKAIFSDQGVRAALTFLDRKRTLKKSVKTKAKK
jgi:hypothetical protein